MTRVEEVVADFDRIFDLADLTLVATHLPHVVVSAGDMERSVRHGFLSYGLVLVT